MKLNGRKNLSPSNQVVALPRDAFEDEDGNLVPGDLIFKLRAVPSMKDFETHCPKPEPPKKLVVGGDYVDNEDSPQYIQELEDYGDKRIAFMMLKSLEATEGLEWDKVKLEDHTTWSMWKDELLSAGLAEMEIQRLTIGMMRANSLDEAHIEEARSRFLDMESRK
jgi:hypothetical protein